MIRLVHNQIYMKYNKLFIASTIAILAPFITNASIDTNLKLGMSGTSVYELQDVLIEQGCLNYQATGYFGLLTLNAVKCFQLAHGIPNTGYVGVLTRAEINAILTPITLVSNEAEIQEMGTVTAVPQPAPTPVVIIQTPITPPIVQEIKPSLSLFCTDQNVSAGIGNKVYGYTVSADWNKIESVIIKFDIVGYTSGRMMGKENISLKRNYIDTKDVKTTEINYTINAYENTPNGIEEQNNITQSFSGTITMPSCE